MSFIVVFGKYLSLLVINVALMYKKLRHILVKSINHEILERSRNSPQISEVRDIVQSIWLTQHRVGLHKTHSDSSFSLGIPNEFELQPFDSKSSASTCYHPFSKDDVLPRNAGVSDAMPRVVASRSRTNALCIALKLKKRCQ